MWPNLKFQSRLHTLSCVTHSDYFVLCYSSLLMPGASNWIHQPKLEMTWFIANFFSFGKKGEWPVSSRLRPRMKSHRPQVSPLGCFYTCHLRPLQVWITSWIHSYTFPMPEWANTKNYLTGELVWESVWYQFLDFRHGNGRGSSSPWKWGWTLLSLETSVNFHRAEEEKLDLNSVTT